MTITVPGESIFPYYAMMHPQYQCTLIGRDVLHQLKIVHNCEVGGKLKIIFNIFVNKNPIFSVQHQSFMQ